MQKKLDACLHHHLLANIIDASKRSSTKRKGPVDADQTAALNAWHKECIRAFIMESGDRDALEPRVQDPFHRLLLHGVCEFYNLVSVTVTESKDAESPKMTRITKKKKGVAELPNSTLIHFLRMSKEGIW
ncbi:hypothetical protein ACB094_01G361000 [Castanea mollissima]